jgi:predicted ATPase/class 3 adenylate cyclase
MATRVSTGSTRFGELLRRARQVAGLTQAELAERAGLSRRGINDLERGVRQTPRKDTVALLAEALGLSEEERTAFAAAARYGSGQAAPAASTASPLSAAQGESTAPSAVAPALPTGTVTFLFTDIEGSTHLLQHVGAARYAVLQVEHRRLVQAAVAAHSGHEVDSQGDSFFVAFPTAHDALAAAVQVQRALAAHRWPAGAAVRVRMGLHTGAAQVSGDRYVGLEVHRAARIAAAGHGGQMLLSQTTHALVEDALPDGASVSDLGAHRLKDLQRPEHLFQLVLSDLPGLPADFPPLNALDRHPHNLPIQPTPLVGRERELAAVVTLLRREDVRLVTLTGAGGVGKTRLALQVAAELVVNFADGVFFAPLSRLADPELVLPTIARTLGLQETGSQPIRTVLREWLRTRQLLLLLDNCEQVAAAAPEVGDLLASSPGLKVLATSRVALHLRGEKQVQVRPLPLPDPAHLPPPHRLVGYPAVALFVQCAHDADAAFALTNATALAIAAICTRVDGLPLAIELAAAKVRVLAPSALLARLERQLPLLTGGARDLEARQQTMRNTLAWSEGLLPPEEQRLFRRLAVFVGGFTLEAAEAVCAVPEGAEPLGMDVLDGLERLVDQSLVQPWTVDSAEERDRVEEGEGGGEARFRLLYVIREYALEQLEASGEADALRRAHAVYYLGLSEQAEPELRGAGQVEWLWRLEREHDNLRTALAWALERSRSEHALRQAGALVWFWYVRGYLSEGQRWLAQALALAEREQPRGTAAAEAEYVVSRTELAQRAKALYGAGLLRFWTFAEPDTARALFEESVRLWRALGDKWWMAVVLKDIGLLMTILGDLQTARVRLEEAVSLAREVEDKWALAAALSRLGRVLDDIDARAAPPILEEAVAVARVVGDKSLLADTLGSLASAYYLLGNLEAIAPAAEEAMAAAQAIQSKLDMALSLLALTMGALAQGKPAAAKAYAMQTLALARKTGMFAQVVLTVLSIGCVACAGGPAEGGARLLAALEALARRVAGNRILGVGMGGGAIEHMYRQHVDVARTQLDPDTFAAAWAEGQRMTMEQAFALATEIVGADAALPEV